MPKAVTMWEFSWLLRRSGAQREYADIERVLDELVERGYDCVRIDAFPHLIAADRAGNRQSGFAVHPQPDHFMWGPHGRKVVVEHPEASLAAFVSACRDRGVTVALSSWFNDDDEHRRLGIATPDDLARVWYETLESLEAAAVLDAIEFVDLCNEFPLDDWLPAAHESIFGRPEHTEPSVPGQAVEGGWVWTPPQRAVIESFFAATDLLRARWPRLRFTYSLAPVSESLFDLDYRSLDVIETHIWLSSNVEEYASQTNFSLEEHGFPGAWQKQVDSLDEVYWPQRERWHAQLEAQMARWSAVAKAAGVPLWTTEGWSHILLDDFTAPSGRTAWEYVKDVAEFAVPAALRLGWEGVCTSNFAEPHFPALWADIEWHRRLTTMIKSGTGGML
ncbi:cellulase-like family protein [Herbiconiux sp. UC225_62]|uniref:cellulase-like family protein n=1 Tax=Herbiconiux sp. UC225_62 TaxID=3350168 RepID=UPI0036D41583